RDASGGDLEHHRESCSSATWYGRSSQRKHGGNLSKNRGAARIADEPVSQLAANQGNIYV
ncbi:MAG TPA: hypothetical protein VGI70_01080, partial [Polyangiales bacterium]